ncbi:hypothetical protein EQG49_13350 [Periweissella cryptocerci]|uniref:Uncharacterized protein n=1 Tax=Periweissella cryptocerci TaxID=2506420 RepID=A0A4P6YX99_9LACO|nr:hypothetical protein [Periweissella cryptocerci]QBO37383.1 hypothetical protein EQG49_13350 [Periweissella cryptocerci]
MTIKDDFKAQAMLINDMSWSIRRSYGKPVEYSENTRYNVVSLIERSEYPEYFVDYGDLDALKNYQDAHSDDIEFDAPFIRGWQFDLAAKFQVDGEKLS